jgi:hypothetical protein
VHRSSLDTLGFTKADGRRFSGLSIVSSSGVRCRREGSPGVVAPVGIRKASIGPNEEEPHPNTEYGQNDITVRPSARGFRGLKPSIKSSNYVALIALNGRVHRYN